MDYSIKNFNSYVNEGSQENEYEICNIQSIDELEELISDYWNHFSNENKKFFNALLNKDKNNIFLVLDNYTKIPKYIIFWDRMIVIDSSKSVFMLQEYDNFLQNNKEIKRKIEKFLKSGEMGYQDYDFQKSSEYNIKPEIDDATISTEPKHKVVTGKIDMQSLRNLHLDRNKNLAKTTGFSKIPRPRY